MLNLPLFGQNKIKIQNQENNKIRKIILWKIREVKTNKEHWTLVNPPIILTDSNITFHSYIKTDSIIDSTTLLGKMTYIEYYQRDTSITVLFSDISEIKSLGRFNHDSFGLEVTPAMASIMFLIGGIDLLVKGAYVSGAVVLGLSPVFAVLTILTFRLTSKINSYQINSEWKIINTQSVRGL